MAMAEPRLDYLPKEIYFMIFDNGCSQSDIAHLVLCNKFLYQKLESVLYDGSDAQYKAIKWACLNGKLDTIQKSIWYGASVHRSTYLCLASKKQQEQVIRLLVDLGVRILSPDMDKKRRLKGIEEFRYCAQNLCSSRLSHEQSSSLLWLLYEKAIDEQGRKKWDVDTALPLITLIRSPAGAPIDLIRQVLDDGADPNEPRPFKYRDSLSPLSAAIIANSEPAFHLLLQRGASINGTSVKYWAKKGLHLPIFAAAMMLAVADHGKIMMQLCLDNGADINCERICKDYQTQTLIRWTAGKNEYPQMGIYTRHTPLHTFLASIKSFKSRKLPNPLERLNWFFENATGWKAPPVTFSESIVEGWGFIAKSSSIVNILIDKWGPEKFSDAKFTDIIRILLRHQTVYNCPLSEYLTKFIYNYQGCPNQLAKHQRMKDGVATFVKLLLDNWDFNIRKTLFFEDLNDVLANVIRKKQFDRRGEFYMIIIEKLIEAGANINATNTRYMDDREELSAMHYCCDEAKYDAETFGELLDDGTLWFKYEHYWLVRYWIPELIEHGADPTMPAGDKRMTALDLLVAVDYRHCKSGTQKEAIDNYVQGLAERWRKLHEDGLACGKKPAI